MAISRNSGGGFVVIAVKTRPAAVAGLFYPDDPEELRQWLKSALGDSQESHASCKAMVVPHAGYIYSGGVAATAYKRLLQFSQRIQRIVLLGPAHRVGFEGIAVPTVDCFATPLGTIKLDRDAIDGLSDLPQVIFDDLPHAEEHCLEVQLPFLQALFKDNVTLVPLVVGMTTSQLLADVIQRLWGDQQTLILVSSDLSHYHDYHTARQLDAETSAAIESGQIDFLDSEHACGYLPIQGLLEITTRYGLKAKTIDLRNSGDTAGPKDRVVGYGAYVFQ